MRGAGAGTTGCEWRGQYWYVPCSALEFVTHAVHGEDVFAGFQLAPQVADVRINGALVTFKCHAAHRIEQLRAGEDAPGLAHQRGHDLKLRGGERDGAVRQIHLITGAVEGDRLARG